MPGGGPDCPESAAMNAEARNRIRALEGLGLDEARRATLPVRLDLARRQHRALTELIAVAREIDDHRNAIAEKFIHPSLRSSFRPAVDPAVMTNLRDDYAKKVAQETGEDITQ